MLWGIAFFNYADRQAVFSLFPLLQRDMRLTPVQLGMLGSSFAIVYGLAAPVAGHIVDRVKRKSAILGGLYIWSLICVATATARNFVHLLTFRAAEGLGETIYYPASTSLIGDYHGIRTRSRALGMLVTAVYMGTIAGGFAAGLIGEHYGWRRTFVIFGSAGILLGILLQRYVREAPRGMADVEDLNAGIIASEQTTDTPVTGGAMVRRDISFWSLLRIVIHRPTALLLMGAFLCANFVAMVLLSWMPKFLYDRYHLGLAVSGLAATVFVQLASTVGSPLGGWMADGLRQRTPGGRLLVQALGVFAGAPFVVLCGLTHSFAWLVVALTAWGFFKGIYDANIFASVFDVIPAEARGSVTGLMNMVGWLGGGGTGPVVIGILASHFGLGLAIATASVVYCAAGALLLIGAFAYAGRDTVAMEAEVRQSAFSKSLARAEH